MIDPRRKGTTRECEVAGVTGVVITKIAQELLDVGIGIPDSAPASLANLAVAMYESLATGSALSPTNFDGLSAASGIAADVIRVAAARWLEFDGDGGLTGFGGLTLQPTQHRLVLDGHDFYLWCVLDGFVVAHALGRPVRIETHCPTTGTRIEVLASREGVEHVEPRNAVMSVIVPESGAACSVSDTRHGFCDFVNFYRSEQVALDSAKRPGAAVLTMDMAFALARRLTLPLLNARR